MARHIRRRGADRGTRSPPLTPPRTDCRRTTRARCSRIATARSGSAPPAAAWRGSSAIASSTSRSAPTACPIRTVLVLAADREDSVWIGTAGGRPEPAPRRAVFNAITRLDRSGRRTTSSPSTRIAQSRTVDRHRRRRPDAASSAGDPTITYTTAGRPPEQQHPHDVAGVPMAACGRAPPIAGWRGTRMAPGPVTATGPRCRRARIRAIYRRSRRLALDRQPRRPAPHPQPGR